jgi:hypothetical protein
LAPLFDDHSQDFRGIRLSGPDPRQSAVSEWRQSQIVDILLNESAAYNTWRKLAEFPFFDSGKIMRPNSSAGRYIRKFEPLIKSGAPDLVNQ